MSQGGEVIEQLKNHMNWLESVMSSMPPVRDGKSSTSSNEYEESIDDLLASIELPKPGSKQPKVSDVCAQYTELVKAAYSSDPAPSQLQPEPVYQYRMSEIVDSEDESDCEEYYTRDAEEIRGQKIPLWAQASQLMQELEKQQGVDPDKIFINFEKTCDLSAMFEKKKKTFTVRGDSGWWAADALTPSEEKNYKKAVGLV